MRIECGPAVRPQDDRDRIRVATGKRKIGNRLCVLRSVRSTAADPVYCVSFLMSSLTLGTPIPVTMS